MPQEYSCFPAPHQVESAKEALTGGALLLSFSHGPVCSPFSFFFPSRGTDIKHSL